MVKAHGYRSVSKVEDLILKRLDSLEEKMDLCRVEIAGLKVKSGVWGAIAGTIPVLVGVVMWAMSLP